MKKKMVRFHWNWINSDDKMGKNGECLVLIERGDDRSEKPDFCKIDICI